VNLYNLLKKRIESYIAVSKQKGYFLEPSVKEKMREVFLNRWSPERLMGLSGRQLLYKMFGDKNDDSLTYWLENKHTDDFYSLAFGNISGGAADNFILFKYKAIGGRWSAKLYRKDMPEEERQYVGMSEEYAIRLAELIRDTLIRGVEEVEKLKNGVISYRELEENLQRIHRDLTDSIPTEISPYFPSPKNLFHRAWVHKYLHILYPEHISGFHSSKALLFIPISMAHNPMPGSYQNDGVLKQIISACGYRSFLEVELLNRQYPVEYCYVKISTSIPQVKGQLDNLLSRGILTWDGEPPVAIRKIDTGKRIFVVSEDNTLLAYGYATEPFTEGSTEIDFILTGINQKVDIRSKEPVKQYYDQILLKYSDELVSVEKAVLEAEFSRKTYSHIQISPKMSDDVAEIWTRLRRKKQIILYGPPGTGKTYLAMKSARHIVAVKNLGEPYREDLEEQISNYIRMVTFHPSYSYDDFVEGIKITLSEDGQIAYEIRDGVFKEFAHEAEEDKNHIYILIIDEINRGDTARIFGELITLLEADKRGRVKVKLPLSGDDFTIPPNLYIIGTMNTSDRSIAMVDAALRRRFAFLRMWPDYSLLDSAIGGIHLGTWLKLINDRLKEAMGPGAQDLLIGHSYLMIGEEPIRDVTQLRRVLESEIIPLLEEYFKGDIGAVRRVLGEGVISDEGKLPETDEELVVAILEELGGPQSEEDHGEDAETD